MRLPLLTLILLTTSTVATEPDSPALAAGKKRQEAIKSIEFVGKFTDVTEIGGHGTTRPALGEKPRFLPSERETWEGTVRVLIDGECSRVEITKTGTGGGTFREVIVCDGTTRKRLQGPTSKKTEKLSHGMIETAATHLEWPNPTYQPAFIVARPLGISGWHPWFPLTKGNPTGSTAVIDEITMDEWSWAETPSTVYRSWINPQAGHTVRRVRYESKLSSFQTDIIWKQHESVWWMPTSWETVWTFDDGTPRHTIKATLDMVKLNEPIHDREFDVAFPPGSKVDDERTNTGFLVLEDGTLSRKVRGQSDEPISPTTPSSPNWFAANGPWLASVVLVIGVVALLALRRMRRKRNTFPNSGDSG